MFKMPENIDSVPCIFGILHKLYIKTHNLHETDPVWPCFMSFHFKLTFADRFLS